MGKGDQRTRKGKIKSSSYGKTRRHAPIKKSIEWLKAHKRVVLKPAPMAPEEESKPITSIKKSPVKEDVTREEAPEKKVENKTEDKERATA